MNDDNEKQGRIWFVTGAARGLGRELVTAALRHGDSVVAAVRNTQRLDRSAPFDDDRVLVTTLDVTDEAQAQEAIEAALVRFGRIDVVVNNAGHGLLGAVEETTAQQVRGLLATNVEGVLNVTRAVLPVLRAQGSGHLINISSLGGFASSPGNGVYGATKFAVEGLSEALAGELEPLGIKVTIVEPGFFRTDFLSGQSIALADRRIADYEMTIDRERVLERHGQQPGDPRKAADAIVELVGSEHPPLRLPLGVDAVERISGKLERVRAELDTWRDLSLSTGFVLQT